MKLPHTIKTKTREWKIIRLYTYRDIFTDDEEQAPLCYFIWFPFSNKRDLIEEPTFNNTFWLHEEDFKKFLTFTEETEDIEVPNLFGWKSLVGMLKYTEEYEE